MVESKEKQIIDFVIENPQCSSKDILDGISISTSYATIKRILSKLTNDNLLIINGKGKGSKYSISPLYKLIQPIDVEQYYKQEIDERSIIDSFNINLIREILNEVDVFTTDELKKLSALQDKYTNNISQLTELEYKKELERLAIDLSWKSSQIEGNTYTLLETERLIKDRETATGKSKEEASMLLNHKDAIDFIIANPDYLEPLTISKVEDIHSILTKELNIDRNIR